jgi:hypothetical protein
MSCVHALVCVLSFSLYNLCMFCFMLTGHDYKYIGVHLHDDHKKAWKKERLSITYSYMYVLDLCFFSSCTFSFFYGVGPVKRNIRYQDSSLTDSIIKLKRKESSNIICNARTSRFVYSQ